MKIIVVHEGTTVPTHSVQSGTENLGAIFGGYWHGIQEAWNITADVVLTPGTGGIAEFLIKNGRSPHWGKIVSMQEAGFSVVNTHWYLDNLKKANFDAFLVYNLEPLFEVLGKPVFKFRPAYPFFKQHLFPPVKKDYRKVGLYLNRFLDSTANLLGTLAVFKRLPPEVNGYCYLGQQELDILQPILNRLGFGNRISLLPPTTWENYLAATSDFKLFLSMDFRMTWGRFDLDAAMVRSRCVGAHTAVKNILWPELVVCPDDVEGAAELAIAELEAPDYNILAEKTALFSYPEVERHIRNCVSSI